ncbi:MAG TPA: bifunctional DNA-binding transcriptional regulator/O6-methylguanine-DNA methyltransferase Ada [Candidatus Bathyarchaeia archaeon]|nr:bifunctional DNA-binding transcriptional regulator/O6-methylguanine-DNA methyltransferase Ada [Candidatus Bathyarchaeia archaeon]
MLTVLEPKTAEPPAQQDRKLLLTDDEKWRAVLDRDSRFDGAFVTGVRSTGIYCKPSCATKHPKREHVVFLSGPDEAKLAGFRACLRCRPSDKGSSPRTELIGRVCKYIETHLDQKLSLSTLSTDARISPYHLQRTFKRVLGISPREYIEARRLEKVKVSLRKGQTVTNALYNAGFTSKARLYEKRSNHFGMNPGTFRRGGDGEQIHYSTFNSPVGRILIGFTPRGLCALYMGNSDREVEKLLIDDFPMANCYRNDGAIQPWTEEFMRYFSGEPSSLDLPLDIQATAFQRRVWERIRSIPYGETKSYSNIAVEIGQPTATRAVARACATNPVALVIPCHRVIGKDGSLTGYGWGMKRKQALLALEQRRNNMQLGTE